MKVSTSGLRQDSPAIPLLLALISYQGVTSGAGSAAGLTIVDADLANEPSYDGQLVKVRSGNAAGQIKPIYVMAAGVLTFATPWTDSTGAVVQITAGTLFDILSISGGGGGGPTPSPQEGLSYYGIVNAVPGANQFTIGSLAGLGAGKFADAVNPYIVFVLRDAGGASAAPQGEFMATTAYVTGTGVFTTGAFTAAIGVGDEILLIHPGVMSGLIPSLAGNVQYAGAQIDLNQAAAAYPLLTGAVQVVMLEALNIKMPNIVAGGALTGITIETDDVTPGVIISAPQGLVANLTAEADLQWRGNLRIAVATVVQLTIVGGAHGIAYVCDVTAKYRAIVNGGSLV